MAITSNAILVISGLTLGLINVSEKPWLTNANSDTTNKTK